MTMEPGQVVGMLKVTGTDKFHPMIFCPGCKCGHVFDERWTWNGDKVKPTFSPSMLVSADDPKCRCHSYVRNGNIEFLSDCAHELRSQSVPLRSFGIDEAIPAI
jgi:hypothetical protein